MADNTARIEIDHTQIDEDLTDFPVLIVLNKSVLPNVFTKTDGTASINPKSILVKQGETSLYTEIESHKLGTDEEVRLWSKVPTISSTADSVLDFFWGGAENTYTNITGTTAAQNVWDEDFVGVWHMAQDPSGGVGCILDSTDNESHGNPSSTGMTQVDHGILMPTSQNNFINIPQSSAPTLNQVTLEAYAKALDSGGSGYGRFIQIGASLTGCVELYITSPDLIKARINDNSVISVTADNIVYEDVDKYYTATYDKETLNLFLDGELAEQKIYSLSTINSSTAWNIGNWSYTDPSRAFHGEFYEARISKISRSTAWVKATNEALRNTLVAISTDNYTLSGIVTNGQEAIARTVHLYDRIEGTLEATTTSNATTGAFIFEHLDNKQYFIIALDDDAGESFNAQVFDKLLPVDLQ